jgi:hypothetical protein
MPSIQGPVCCVAQKGTTRTHQCRDLFPDCVVEGGELEQAQLFDLDVAAVISTNQQLNRHTAASADSWFLRSQCTHHRLRGHRSSGNYGVVETSRVGIEAAVGNLAQRDAKHLDQQM